MVTADQIRMARAALKWGVRELAARAGFTPNTISRIENGAESRSGTLQKIEETFRAAGVEFIAENGGGAGVRLAKPVRRKRSSVVEAGLTAAKPNRKKSR
jgi:transcriptional regulator with XRE-family HTH domain